MEPQFFKQLRATRPERILAHIPHAKPAHRDCRPSGDGILTALINPLRAGNPAATHRRDVS